MFQQPYAPGLIEELLFPGFGEKFLEKDPLKQVAHEPLHLLDRLRHQRTTKVLSPEKETKIEELVGKFIVDCKIKGIQVRNSTQT